VSFLVPAYPAFAGRTAVRIDQILYAFKQAPEHEDIITTKKAFVKVIDRLIYR
jgi:hypothetical protein